jgi:hypothetical protein
LPVFGSSSSQTASAATAVSRKNFATAWLGLDAAIARIQVMMALERRVLTGEDEFAEYQMQGENENFGRFTINLLDELEIDFDTHEYRINGGDWINALTADEGGRGPVSDIGWVDRRRIRFTGIDY